MEIERGPYTSDWSDFARCKGRGELFYDQPKETPPQRRLRVAQAKRYCVECPAKVACRTMGRINREHGIWGGETDEERAAAGYLPLRSTSRRIRAAWQPRHADKDRDDQSDVA